MKNHIRVIAALTVLAAFACSNQRTEMRTADSLVYLRDGRKIRGAVIAATSTVLLVHTTKGVRRVARRNVARQVCSFDRECSRGRQSDLPLPPFLKISKFGVQRRALILETLDRDTVRLFPLALTT